MKKFLLTLAVLTALTGCSSFRRWKENHSNHDAAPAQVQSTAAAAPTSGGNGVDTSHLKLGTWSYEVHEMAKAAGCEGDGAWLITPPSPIQEAYREVCPHGGSFTAVCDSVHCVRK